MFQWLCVAEGMTSCRETIQNAFCMAVVVLWNAYCSFTWQAPGISDLELPSPAPATFVTLLQNADLGDCDEQT